MSPTRLAGFFLLFILNAVKHNVGLETKERETGAH